MFSKMQSVLRAATRQSDEPLNILTVCTHESYETNLCKTGHNFYAFRLDTLKNWDKKYRPVPKNYTLLNPHRGQEQLPEWVDFDLVLSQNKFASLQILQQFAQELQLPLVSLEHCLPGENSGEARLRALKALRGDVNVFISEFSRKGWMWGDDEADVVHHGIDTSLFCSSPIVDKAPHALSVVNAWIERDRECGYKFWKAGTEGLATRVVGNTPGLSEPARSVQELVRAYQKATCFVNTSLISPVPMALLEAMACGLPVVSTNTCMIPEIISHGVNGYLCEKPEDVRYYTNMLLSSPELCESIGKAARQTIIEKFSIEQFVTKWNAIFRKAANIIVK
jgi:hypothetical protein